MGSCPAPTAPCPPEERVNDAQFPSASPLAEHFPSPLSKGPFVGSGLAGNRCGAAAQLGFVLAAFHTQCWAWERPPGSPSPTWEPAPPCHQRRALRDTSRPSLDTSTASLGCPFPCLTALSTEKSLPCPIFPEHWGGRLWLSPIPQAGQPPPGSCHSQYPLHPCSQGIHHPGAASGVSEPSKIQGFLCLGTA